MKPIVITEICRATTHFPPPCSLDASASETAFATTSAYLRQGTAARRSPPLRRPRRALGRMGLLGRQIGCGGGHVSGASPKGRHWVRSCCLSGAGCSPPVMPQIRHDGCPRRATEGHDTSRRPHGQAQPAGRQSICLQATTGRPRGAACGLWQMGRAGQVRRGRKWKANE